MRDKNRRHATSLVLLDKGRRSRADAMASFLPNAPAVSATLIPPVYMYAWQELGVMEGILPEADMARWVAARSKPKFAALMLTHLVRRVRCYWLYRLRARGIDTDSQTNASPKPLPNCNFIRELITGRV